MKIEVNNPFIVCCLKQEIGKNFILFLFLLFAIINSYSQQDKIQKLTDKDGLPSSIINAIIQDEIGYLWLATDKGFSKFDGNTFTNYKNEKTTSVFTKDKFVYIGLEKGLFVKNKNEISFIESKEVLKITSIHDKITVATVEGLYQLREDYLLPLKIHTKVDFSIINDVILFKNSTYIASNSGLWILDKLYKPTTVTKIVDGNFVSLLISDDKIIGATSKNGLQIIHQNKVIETIKTEKNISSIHIVNNALWVSTKNEGIEIYDLHTFSFKQKINKYNTPISNQIQTVFKDQQNAVWIASKEGLYKYKNTHPNDINTFIKPEIFLENIAVNYKNLDSIYPPDSKNKIKLHANENNISFTYKTIDLNQSKNILYRYKLNNKYSPWSSKNSVEFASLTAGNYKFAIQSKKGKFVSDEKHFPFSIDLPIYKKIWFIILCLVILLFLASFFVDLHIKKNNKKDREKISKLQLENHLLTLEQKALQLQMNPHFIFNVLNGIKALGNSGKPKELNKIISQFSILLRSVLNNSRLEEISLQDEIETLKNYVELEQKMNAKSFEYRIETSLNNIDTEEILIPPMLLQPFVENCIKHAFQPNTKDPEIRLIFKVNHNFLHFTIEDNGIGFQQSKKEKANTSHQSIALKVTKERLQHLSKYNSFSMKEIKVNNIIKGTKIEFKIPLKTDF